MKKPFLLIIFFVSLVFTYASGDKEKQINIYYSSSLNGNLDGCDCSSNPKAGLVKRAIFLRDIDKDNSLLLDTGDIFDVYRDTLLSDYILQSYIDLRYDAVAIGDQEFSNGADYILKGTDGNLIKSSNIRIKDNEGVFRQISGSHLLFKRADMVITVISIADPGIFRFYPDKLMDSIDIENPRTAIQRILNNPATEESDIVLLLFHGSLNKARDMASLFQSIDIIIAGHEQQILNGEMVGNTIIVSPGGEGNLLGDLEVRVQNQKLTFSNNFVAFNYLTDPDDPVIRNRIGEYNNILKQRLNN